MTGSQKPDSLPVPQPFNRMRHDMQLSDATIVFDLDGTLVDTAPDLAAATNHALAGAGLKPMSVAELRPFIGYGSRVMLDAGLRHHGLSLREPEVSGLHERFFTFYADHVAVSSQPYAGVRELLKRCAARVPALPSAPTSMNTCRRRSCVSSTLSLCLGPSPGATPLRCANPIPVI